MEKDRDFIYERSIVGLASDCSGEYVLPDYNNDVKKLLHVRARAVPSLGFLDGDDVDYSGVVYFEVLYSDAEGELSNCEFTCDYEFKVRSSADGYVDNMVDTRVAGFSIRLLGPRKIAVKVGLTSDVHISERGEIDIMGDTFSKGVPECAITTARIGCASYSERYEREYAEEIAHIDGVIADEVQVVFSDCEMKVTSVNAVQGGVEYKGELGFSVIVKIADEAPATYKKSVSIDEIIAFESQEDMNDVGVNTWITSSKPTVSADEDGVGIVMSVITDSRSYARKNENVRVVTDCYLKDRRVENEYGDFSYTEIVGMQGANDELTAEAKRDELGLADVHSFVVSDATARVEEVEISSGLAKILGNARFSSVACEVLENGELGYLPIKIEAPFELNVNINSQIPENTRAECSLLLSNVTCRTDSSKVYFSSDVSVCLGLFSEHRLRRLTVSNTTDIQYETDPSVITVYYPKHGDTLFDVARRFHTSVSAIAADNSLSQEMFSSLDKPSSLTGVTRLIIK